MAADETPEPDWAALLSTRGGLRRTFAGSQEIVIGLTALFWPRFGEYDGMIFACLDGKALGEERKDEIKGWMRIRDGERWRVERIENWQEVWNLLEDAGYDCAREQLVFIGERLVEIWLAKLARDYPERRFASFVMDEGEGGQEDVQLSFWQAGEDD